MVGIIILNPIGSYKVNFNGTKFFLRPIFYLKTRLMKEINDFITTEYFNIFLQDTPQKQ